MKCFSVPCKIKYKVLFSLVPVFHYQQGNTYEQGHTLRFICFSQVVLENFQGVKTPVTASRNQ